MCELLSASMISYLANAATIGGVVFAVYAYRRWRQDYYEQIVHEYAYNLLKKLRRLHLELEKLRKLKFHNPETVADEIHEKLLPDFIEKVNITLYEIEIELLMANCSLLKNRDFQAKFINLFRKNILSPLNRAIVEFERLTPEEKHLKLKTLNIWKLVYPSECNIEMFEIKKSPLGTETEVIDDEFNKDMENTFEELYKYLEDNLIQK